MDKKTIYQHLADWLLLEPINIAKLEKQLDMYPTSLSKFANGKGGLNPGYKRPLLSWAFEKGFSKHIGFCNGKCHEKFVVLEAHLYTGNWKTIQQGSEKWYEILCKKESFTFTDLEYERFTRKEPPK